MSVLTLSLSSIEQRQRSLNAVANTLNIVIPDDAIRSLFTGPARGRTPRSRYFPNEQLLIAIGGLLEDDDFTVIAPKLVDIALVELSGSARNTAAVKALASFAQAEEHDAIKLARDEVSSTTAPE